MHLQWKDYKGGTGAMCKALRSKEIDIAVILTEGIVKDITEGNPSKIVQTYVQSPLLWGIHVASAAPYKNLEDLKGTIAAISRYGSGSHLMSYVLGAQLDWNLDKLQFKVVKNLDGAVNALTHREADYFLWEHFTTKPLVDQKIFRRIKDCPTPWPCFVIAVRNEILEDQLHNVQSILTELHKETKIFKSIKNIEKILAHRYSQKVEDIEKWLYMTNWGEKLPSEKEITNVLQTLHELKLIKNKVPYQSLIHSV